MYHANSCKEDSAQWRALPAQFAQQWAFGRAAQSSALARWSWSPFCTTSFPDKTRVTPRPSIVSCRTCLRCYQGTVISVMRAMSSSSKVSNIGTYARVTIKFKMTWKDKSSWPSWIHVYTFLALPFRNSFSSLLGSPNFFPWFVILWDGFATDVLVIALQVHPSM